MRKLILIWALTIASAPAFATDAVEAFRKGSSSYSLLQTDLSVLKIYTDTDATYRREASRAGVRAAPDRTGDAGRQWCRIAKSYDRYVADLQRVIKDKEYLDLSQSKFVEVADRDLPAFKTELEGRSIDLRDAERRCKP